MMSTSPVLTLLMRFFIAPIYSANKTRKMYKRPFSFADEQSKFSIFGKYVFKRCIAYIHHNAD